MDEATEAIRQVAVGPYIVELMVGDVAERAGRLPIVSSDDNYLSHAGGASAAIWAEVGDELRTDAAVLAVEHGDRPRLAHVLTSRVGQGRVPVLHAITVDYDLGERLSPRDLALLYTNLLKTADEEGLTQIALPLVGCGTARIKPADTIRALLDVVLSRKLMPSGQFLSVLLQSDSLDEAREGFDRWLDQHADALDGDDADEEVQPPPPPDEPQPPSPPSGSPARTAPRLQRVAEARMARPKAASTGSGRWERLARQQSLGLEVIQAAQALDRTPNARAAEPALHLWNLLDKGQDDQAMPPAELRHVVDLARSARARLALGTGDQAELLSQLNRGIEAFLDPAASTAIAQSTPVLVGAARADYSRGGTRHVRQLYELLRTTLTDQQLEAEEARLRDLGYRGARGDRLLENCASDDPLDVLLRHFSGNQIGRLLAEREIPRGDNERPSELARRLLEHLGFPQRESLVDPAIVKRDVAALASEVHALSVSELRGRIASLAIALEAVLRTYLRFLTQGLLDVAPDIWLEDRYQRKRAAGQILPPRRLDKVTLGSFSPLVGAARKAITKSRDARVQARVEGLMGESQDEIRWIPPQTGELARLRNAWVHAGADEATPALSPQRARSLAREFCEVADAVLTGLIEGPFPSVIEIVQIEYDSWGRRHVRARTSKGTIESIFTDLELVPGQAYLMHARTNPMRVDPLLVRQAAVSEDSVSDDDPG